jgi:YebC/PmpR family DNA-binding regulatory protein
MIAAMSGHSKWSTIKRKKAAADAKRGKIFTQLIRELTVAAKEGGGNPDANPRLRLAMEHARAQNMPGTNIDRAIKRGTGGLEGESYAEVRYEGYGPGGVAVMVDVLTDNRNRTVGEIRHLFTKHGGNLGANGCVAYLFDQRGVLVFEVDRVDSDALMEAALEADADDLIEEGGIVEVRTAPERLEEVRRARATSSRSRPRSA